MNLHPDAPDQRTVCDLPKNKREICRIQLRTFENVRLIDIRAYVKRDDGEVLPSKKGICLTVGSIAALREALSEAERIARQMGWLSEERKAA